MAEACSSRARMLAALECREPDYVPCCFEGFTVLRDRCADQREYLDRQLAMGLDVVVHMPGLSVRHDPRVTTEERREEQGRGLPDILHKEYRTPAGRLRTSVRVSDDWPHGDHVPFLDDFVVSRAHKPLVTADDSLEAFAYLLAPPTEAEIAAMREQRREVRALAEERDLLRICGDGMVGDLACWVAGLDTFALMAADAPEFVQDFLGIIEEWDTRRMNLAIAQDIDLWVRRAWYENADVWSPRQYEKFILPGLRRQVAQAHAAGVKFAYLMSCQSLSLVDMIVEAGVDVLMGIDPAQDRTMDFAVLKQKARGRMCLWGGVCGYLTVECGTEEEIRGQVRQALSVLAPGGGFILAPVTNVRGTTARAWANVEALIDEWKTGRGTACPPEADRPSADCASARARRENGDK